MKLFFILEAVLKITKPNEAIHQFEKAIEKNGKYYQALYQKACCLRILGKPDEASRCFEEALKICDDLSKSDQKYLYHKFYFIWDRGSFLFDNKKYSDAIKYFDFALKNRFISLFDGLVWINKGYCHYFLGEYRKALECFEYVINTNLVTWPIFKDAQYLNYTV